MRDSGPSLNGYYVKKIGQNRGKPRIWLDRPQLEQAGLCRGSKYDVVVDGQTIVLTANTDGSRVVSGKKIGERDNPVIDLNSQELLAIFDGMSAIRVIVKSGQIYLLPLASEIKKQERLQRLRYKLENGLPLDTASVSHGGGILSHALHAGMESAGIQTQLRFVNEIRHDLVEHASEKNDAWSKDTIVYAAPMQALAFDQYGLATVPKVELMDLGLPCVGHSVAGKAARGLEEGEQHPESGHLVIASLILVNQASPAVILYENVTGYASSLSATILKKQLEELGYVTHEKFVNGEEWGVLENRKRWTMIAVTEGLELDFSNLVPPGRQERRLGDVLQQFPADSDVWSEMRGLKAKEIRNKESGSSFKMQIFDESSGHISTLNAGYAKVQSTGAKIRHPDNPDLLRQVTKAEHCAVKQVPEHLVDGLSETVGHQVLGQAVIYPIFRDVGHVIGNGIRKFAGQEPVPLPGRIALDDQSVPDDIRLIAKELFLTLEVAKPNAAYVGYIVAIGQTHVLQDGGRGAGVLHEKSKIQDLPRLGCDVKITYRDEVGKITEKAKQQMTLGI